MISKKFFIVLLMLSFAFAENLNDEFINTTRGTVVENNQNQQYRDDTDAITFEYIKQSKRNDGVIISAGHNNLAYSPKNNTQNSTNMQTLKNNKNIKNLSTPEHTFYLTGYCIEKNSIKIERLSAMSYLECNFDNGNGKLAVLFIPDIYTKALIGKPLYVIFDNLPNKRYFVKGGVVMNPQQTSLNVASIVNDRKINRFLAKTGIDTANIYTKSAMDYLKAKQQSQTQTQVTYIKDDNGNLVPVQSQTTAPPKLSDYLMVSTMQTISNAVKNMSDAFYEDLPYCFKINANSMFYVDLYLTDKPNGLPNINKPTNNLIVKNPPTSKESPSQILLNPINQR